jgi:predicted peptidase
MQQAYRSAGLNYQFYTPARYEPASGIKLPLIVFLHGSGERGDEPELVKKFGLPKELDKWDDFPFLVLSPQCPADQRWLQTAPDVIKLLDEIIEKYGVDRARIYLCGFSMGGEGTWYMAVKYKDRFAAIAPVAGRIPRQDNFLDRLCTIKDLPVWVFHGTDDEAVPFENSQKLYETLKDCGGNVQFTSYQGFGHGETSDRAFSDKALYEWFLRYTR